jgi:TetR/AcrR family transcriptional regulator, tetracycline repressor protein
MSSLLMIACTSYSCQVTKARSGAPADAPGDGKAAGARLSKDVVVERALELADADGLDRLTVRKLATVLGVTPMALYWHFRSKDELLAGLVERVWSEIDTGVDRTAAWPDQLRRLLWSLLSVLRAHPAASRLLLAFDKRSAAAMRPTEVALEILREAGFDPEHAAVVARFALWTGIMLVMSDPASIWLSPEEQAEQQRMKQIAYATLPVATYPRVVECAIPLAMSEDPEAHYEIGASLFVAGVEALAARMGTQ